MRLLDNAVGRVCIALITAMALLITGVGFASVANAADIPDSNNIGDGTTSTVTAEFYKDNKGTPFDPATDKLKPGDTLYGKVTIKFSDEDKPTLDNLNISYTFPDNIDVKNVEEGDLYADGALAGTWLIKNNVAMFKYNEDWLKNHHSDISAYVNFDFTLNNNPSETGDGTKIHFPGTKGDVTIVTDKSELGGKKTWKLNDDGTVTFSVTLNNKFDAKNVVVTDTMGSNFVFRDGSFALDGTALPAGNVSINGQVATVTIGDLKTGKHTLTYTADLSDAAKRTLLAGGKLDDAKNTAQWTWEGSDKPGEDDTTPNFSYNMISKKDGTGTTDDIAWEVTLNSGDLKADMSGYVFTDTLEGGQHYKGTFEVVDPNDNWKVIDTGTIPDDATSFTYTFGADAGKKQYVIRYHTKLDDPSSMDKVSNKGEVTPPDEGKPGGSDEGSFQPTDTNTYVTKQIDENTAATDGKVEWSSLVKMSLMDKDTIPTKIEFIDNSLWGSGIKFDMDKKPVLTLGSKTLVEGTDYTLSYKEKSINIKFKDSADIRGAIGSADVKVTYWTIGDTAPGYYGNTAQVKLNGKTTSASAQYNIEKNDLVEKSGNMKWDKNFKWSDVDPTDTTVGAWVATWTVKANIDQSTNEHGKVDVAGQPITITDMLPEGMSYVPGSATYSARTDWYPHKVEGAKITPTITDGTLRFFIDTKDLTRDDGTCFAYAEVTYNTVAKSTGKDVVFSNHAEAGSGSTNFSSSDATVTGKTDVIDKSGKQISNSNHIKYTIKVNPQGADLIKNNDTLTLTDVMDAKATFVNSSLKITNSLTGAIVTAKVTVDSVKDKDGNPTTKLTIDLPDSTPITVEYEVIPSGAVGDKVHLSNTAQLSGVEQGSSTTEKDWTIHNAGAGTEGAAGTFQINKADASDLSRPLQGAQFELHKVDMNKLPAGEVTDKQVRDVSEKVLDGTTNVDGIVTFGSTESPLETNVLYFFVETKAPTWENSDGSTTSYELDPSLHYVMLKGTDKDAYDAALKQAKDHGITPSANQTYNVYDKRKPAEAKATVTLGKQLSGRAWTDSDKFTFNLAADEANSTVSKDELTAAMPAETTKTVSKQGPGADGNVSAFSYGDFTFDKAGTYAYTVKETGKNGNGLTLDTRTGKITFTVTANDSGALKVAQKVSGLTDLSGTPAFVNKYKPDSATVKNAIKVQKTLAGRQWQDDDSFEFRLAAAEPTPNAPLPSDAKNGYAALTVTDAKEHAFGDITYTKAGVYHYTVSEYTPLDHALPGVDYSNALYEVTVTITDDGNGKLLNGGVVMTKANNDDGTDAGNTKVDGNVAAVTNTFRTDDRGFGLLVTKKYMDKTGTKSLTAGMFSFTLTARDGAPMPEGTAGESITTPVGKDGTASFPNITLNAARDDGKTYWYTLKEDVPEGATASEDGKTATLNGMTYDLTEYRVKLDVAVKNENGKQVLDYSVAILDKDGNKVDAGKLDGGRPVFSNTYDLSPTQATLGGVKRLAGRDMAAGERFAFQLAAASDDTTEAQAARAGLKDDSIVFGDDKSADTMSTTVEGGKDGEQKGFSFDTIHFTKAGSYKFVIDETGKAPQGVTQDEHVASAVVKVIDKGDGTLGVASVTYNNGASTNKEDAAVTDKAAFTNVYNASGYTFFLLHKKLTAASSGISAPALQNGQFTFGLYQGTGVEGKTPVQTKSNITNGITFDRITYTPAALAQAVTDGYATYNATTKTWTLTYTAAELGADGNPVTSGYTKDGIAYDATTRTIIVTVTDDGQGELKTSYRVSDGDADTSDDPSSEDAAFKNMYKPEPTSAKLYAQKQLDGRDWQDGDSFEFKLEAVSGKLTAGNANVAKKDVPMPAESSAGVLTKTVANGDRFDFGDITFTKAGTYVYNISEVTPAQDQQIPGISYSTDMYRATVTVTDNGKGKLSSSVKLEKLPKGDAGHATKVDADGNPTATITNTYSQLEQSWSLKVKKNYTDTSGGNPMVAKQFTFTLKALDGAPLPKGADGDTITTQNNRNGEGAFAAIPFTDKNLGAGGSSKTYTYELSETKGNEAGMTYDTTTYKVEVTVSLDASGTLKVAHVIKDAKGELVKDAEGNAVEAPEFSNTYKPTDATAKLKVHKVLEGKQLKAGDFTFKLYQGIIFTEDGETAIDEQSNDANGDVAFKNLTFDKVGDYVYTIAEQVPAGAVDGVKDGVTYATQWSFVNVHVALDKETGALTATVDDGEGNDGNGHGTTQVVNTYDAAGSVSLRATKAFTNADGSKRDIPANTFQFQLTDENGKTLQTAYAGTDGAVRFKAISYTLDDLPKNSDGGHKAKTFTYHVKEVVPTDDAKLPGVTYDGKEYTYQVTVSDQGNGKLSTAVKVDGKTVTVTTNAPVFTNAYSAAGSTAIAGTKTVTGDDGKNYTDAFGGKFTFTLTGKDGAPIHVASTEDGSGTGTLKDVAKLTAKNNADGTVTFDSLHYSLADLTGVTADGNGVRSKTFTYEVTESGKVDGVTNDAETVKTFTVTVADKGTGKLEVTTNPADTAKLFSFKNAYAATAELGLTGTKTMTGRALKEGESYTFNVYEGTDTTGTPVSTGTSDQSGAISFNNKLTYSLKDLGDHTYTVVESEDNLPGGVTAVTRTHTFTVNVADVDHNGKLMLTTSGLEDKDGNSELAFKNNYATTDSTPIELKGVKLLEDGDYDTTLAQLTGKFTFTLKGENGAPLHVVDSGNTVADKSELTAKNDNAGNVNFGKVIYTFADLNGQTERTFTYTVTESGNVAGVTNDKTLTRTFTVTIKDNGDGTMSATADPASGPLFTFTNQYAAKSVTDSFDFTKRLNGRDLNDGEFAFTLTAGSGADGTAAPMPEGSENGVATAKNDKDGKVQFGEITYAKPGTYTYTVRESAGDLGGVTYDDAVYAVTVTVVDNHDGTMSATHEITRDGEKVSPKDAVFENTYQPAPTTFAFDATKTLKGRALKDGEFRFELRDVDGKTVETVKNSANGKVVFAPVTFDKAGEYTYTIREVAGKATGVAYDSTVYTAKVSVVDNLDGTMSATATYSSGLFGADHKAPAFENTYTPPLSETGSSTLSMGIAMILLLGGGLIMVLARRKEAMGSRLGSQGRHSK